ncbi:hypothetical protein PHET_12208 [Paragonimus heterotremus]|uniref:Glutaredoxin domain-containing protein n=1 Tax=Paragonimus heterotremus TaxID=100268 RepID=A0A8J4SRA5_9TREM|nr:hypothetical protein PHET_12208 [Paragonimus heterotremus]
MFKRSVVCAIKMRGIDFIEFKIHQRPILLIAKEGCSNCKAIEGILSGYHLNDKRPDNYEVLYIESRKDCGVIETYLWHKMMYRNRQKHSNRCLIIIKICFVGWISQLYICRCLNEMSDSPNIYYNRPGVKYPTVLMLSKYVLRCVGSTL